MFKELDDLLKISLLYDFYGALLTDRQREIMELYHEENYTIVEIAEDLSLTKQGVFDALKKAEMHLYSYEEKLGLVEKFLVKEDILKKISSKIEKLKEITTDEKSVKILEDIKKVIGKIED